MVADAQELRERQIWSIVLPCACHTEHTLRTASSSGDGARLKSLSMRSKVKDSNYSTTDKKRVRGHSDNQFVIWNPYNEGSGLQRSCKCNVCRYNECRDTALQRKQNQFEFRTTPSNFSATGGHTTADKHDHPSGFWIGVVSNLDSQHDESHRAAVTGDHTKTTVASTTAHVVTDQGVIAKYSSADNSSNTAQLTNKHKDRDGLSTERLTFRGAYNEGDRDYCTVPTTSARDGHVPTVDLSELPDTPPLTNGRNGQGRSIHQNAVHSTAGEVSSRASALVTTTGSEYITALSASSRTVRLNSLLASSNSAAFLSSLVSNFAVEAATAGGSSSEHSLIDGEHQHSRSVRESLGESTFGLRVEQLENTLATVDKLLQTTPPPKSIVDTDDLTLLLHVNERECVAVVPIHAKGFILLTRRIGDPRSVTRCVDSDSRVEVPSGVHMWSDAVVADNHSALSSAASDWGDQAEMYSWRRRYLKCNYDYDSSDSSMSNCSTHFENFNAQEQQQSCTVDSYHQESSKERIATHQRQEAAENKNFVDFISGYRYISSHHSSTDLMSNKITSSRNRAKPAAHLAAVTTSDARDDDRCVSSSGGPLVASDWLWRSSRVATNVISGGGDALFFDAETAAITPVPLMYNSPTAGIMSNTNHKTVYD
eukprot:Lankesteria_metandrocarpae@DN5612_c0_g1_i1.p1